MSEALEDRHGGIGGEQQPSRAVNIFQSWWLQSFGYALAALYLFYFVILYRAGSWIVDGAGSPIYTDFACAWTAALQAISGHAASLYDPSKFVEMQAAVVGPSDYFYPNWPYPPTFLLILAPFAALGYLHAFVVWDLLTLLGCVAVVYSIVRRRAAIAMALAAPFTAWNLVAAQNGFLTASLLGASLLFLERQPVLAGVLHWLPDLQAAIRDPVPGGALGSEAMAGHRQLHNCGRRSRRRSRRRLRYRRVDGISSGTGCASRFELSYGSRQQLGISPDRVWIDPPFRRGADLAWMIQGLVTLGSAVDRLVHLAIPDLLRTESGDPVDRRASRHALRFRLRRGRNRDSGGFSRNRPAEPWLLARREGNVDYPIRCPICCPGNPRRQCGRDHLRGHAGLPVRRIPAFLRDPASGAAQLW